MFFCIVKDEVIRKKRLFKKRLRVFLKIIKVLIYIGIINRKRWFGCFWYEFFGSFVNEIGYFFIVVEINLLIILLKL